ncbi:TadA family conjugal transfer-associated ATPase [Corynebacterium sp. 335C]
MTAPDLLARVRSRLADGGGAASTADLIAAVRAETGGVVGDAELLDLVRRLRGELSGCGPLDPLLRLPGVTDVLVTAPGAVWVDRGRGLERTGVVFDGDADVRRLAVRLAGACGRRLDDARPWADAHLPGGVPGAGAGVRVHAVLAPPARGATQLSLRVLHPARRGLADLAAGGFAPPEAVDLLRRIVAARLSFLVAGGTGTGKTTLLAALLAEAAPTERILCIEDTPELAPAHPHVVSLTTRPANIEGAGEITQRDLVRQSLRMRPDRVVVGEIRGAEVVDLLAALNTGHDGGAGTVHANSAADVPARLEALGALGGLGREALHAQLLPAIRVVLAVSRRGGRRRLESVGVLAGPPARVEAAWSADGGPAPARAALEGLLGAAPGAEGASAAEAAAPGEGP